ncbi:MAG: hypothetical protein OXE53_18420 [Deltaproteobacteria bacterium]|nr:hypothetical protein [Deltaproteobacteria bacterium]
MSNDGTVLLGARDWGFLQALSDRQPAGPTEVVARMRETGYSLSSTWNITDKLKQEGLVDHLEEHGAYRITPRGCAALDGIVLRATRLMDHRTAVEPT